MTDKCICHSGEVRELRAEVERLRANTLSLPSADADAVELLRRCREWCRIAALGHWGHEYTASKWNGRADEITAFLAKLGTKKGEGL